MKRDIFWRDGQLLHTLDGDAGEAWERIVVPKHRRADVLCMAHDHHMSGYLAHKKMVEHLKRLYTWPGIGRDIQIWCNTCDPCQRIKKGNIYKAPLKLLSVIEAPNGVMAFDLVGPFPRSKDGFKYVLTGICLHSKFPEGMCKSRNGS